MGLSFCFYDENGDIAGYNRIDYVPDKYKISTGLKIYYDDFRQANLKQGWSYSMSFFYNGKWSDPKDKTRFY